VRTASSHKYADIVNVPQDREFVGGKLAQHCIGLVVSDTVLLQLVALYFLVRPAAPHLLTAIGCALR
jgi:hypothetical protein